MSVTLAPTLDHVVINVRGELDEASTQWQKLGFTLTERGHHSLGTSNHLSIFQENYLELLGFEPKNAHSAQDVVNAPKGLNGLVFTTTDAEKLFGEIQAAGLRAEEPRAFHRPVQISTGMQEARFRTVRLGAELVRNGRTLFCEHLTPELVWRDEWQTHANGVTDLTDFIVRSAHPAHTAKLYQQLFGSRLILETIDDGVAFQAGRARVQFITPAAAQARFGPVETTNDGSERNVALTFEVRSIDALRALLARNQVSFVEQRDCTVVVRAAEAVGVAVQFISAPH
ncbi:VOC family protein [Caballeronia sp. LjRoot34]|uniref:VOC family protein n=1 Tax=Caballeronia sp. LjRoot34 TaxID=3342325 RepID=UPI003ECCFD00